MVKKRQRKKNAKNQTKRVPGAPSTRLVNEFKRLRTNTLSKMKRIEKNIGNQARKDAEHQLNLNLSKTASNYQDADEMKLAISEMKSFTNRYNPRFQYVKNVYGVWGNKKDIHYAERQNKANINRAIKELNKVDKVKKQNQDLEFKELLLGKETVANVSVPNAFDFSKIRYQSTWRDKLNSIKNRSKPDYYDKRKWQMQQNFIDIIHLSFHSDADKLVKELKSFTPDEFYDFYLNNVYLVDFEAYDSDGMEDDFGKIAELRSYIKRFKRGEVDTSLKGI